MKASESYISRKHCILILINVEWKLRRNNLTDEAKLSDELLSGK